MLLLGSSEPVYIAQIAQPKERLDTVHGLTPSRSAGEAAVGECNLFEERAASSGFVFEFKYARYFVYLYT